MYVPSRTSAQKLSRLHNMVNSAKIEVGINIFSSKEKALKQ